MVKDVYLETRVLTASPIELVNMLYRHAIFCIQDARKSLAARDISSRSNAICKAIAVISELQSSLDHNAGGDISKRLESLYEYMQSRLTYANIKQEDQPLAEVESLLLELSQAWSEISQAQQTETPEVETPHLAVESGNGHWNAGILPAAEQRSPSYWSA